MANIQRAYFGTLFFFEELPKSLIWRAALMQRSPQLAAARDDCNAQYVSLIGAQDIH